MRRLRALVLPAVARIVTPLLRLSAGRAGAVLVYHGLADGGGDPTQLVRPHDVAVFEAHLRYLRSRYRLVRAGDIQREAASRRRGDPFPVAVTFDDDLASHVRLAAPILERHAAPAAFFLTGASLDAPHAFWWQRLQRAMDEGLPIPVEGGDIVEIAGKVEEMTADERDGLDAWLAERVAPDEDEPGLRSEQVRELVERGFDIGFHTRRHDRLTGLGDSALTRALSEGREELESAAGKPLATVAYPHGRATERVARAAAAAGFRVGFTGDPEPVLPESDPLLLGRLEPVHGAPSGLALQLLRVLSKRGHR